MRELVTFSAEVKPLPRPALVPNGHGGIRYMHSAEYRDYKQTLRTAAEFALPEFWTPFDGPTEIRAVVEFVRPKSLAKGTTFRMKAPDWDNLAKPIQDALTGLVYTDDKTVVAGTVVKLYGPENRVTVQVNALSHDEAEALVAILGPRPITRSDDLTQPPPDAKL